ncbi:DUF6092 family protein [Moorellaceae bacterium AZ2]
MKGKSLVEVLCFLVTSARGCMDEPPIYGPLRLLDAYCRLVEASRENLDSFFWELKEKIEEFKYLAMVDEEGFKGQLDQTVVELARFMEKREEL